MRDFVLTLQDAENKNFLYVKLLRLSRNIQLLKFQIKQTFSKVCSESWQYLLRQNKI